MTTKSNNCYFCYHIVTNYGEQNKGKIAYKSPAILVQFV